MGLRITTNTQSLAAQRALGQTNREIEKSLKQMATGNRFATLDEGAADFAIAEQLKAHSKSLEAVVRNVENSKSISSIAEGALNEQSNLVIRMRELAIQGASTLFEQDQREFLQLEFDQLAQEIDRIAQSTSFGTHALLNGNTLSYSIQAGLGNSKYDQIKTNINADTRLDSLELSGLSITDSDEAQDALEQIDLAFNKIAGARSQFGALQTRLNAVTNHASTMASELQEAHSKMADADIAKVTSSYYQNKALQQYQLAALVEAQHQPAQLIKILG